MRKLFLLLILAPFILNLNAQDKKVKSKVVSATVYSQGAQITRVAKFNLDKGENRVVFTNLPPSLDESSIQVSCSDATIISISYQQNMMDSLAQNPEYLKFQNKKRDLEKKIKLEKALLQTIDTEKDVLLSNKSLVGDQGVKLEDLKNSLVYFRLRLEELERSRVDKIDLIDSLTEELIKINQQIQTFNNQKKTETKEFLVTLKSEKIISTTAEIKYFTSAAGWFPNYDIRIKNVSEPLTLDYKGNIFQTTGENWDKIKLLISSGNPTNSGTAPKINPWFIDYQNFGPYKASVYNSYPPTSIRGTVTGTVTSAEDGLPLPGVSVVVKGTTIGCATDMDGRYRITLPVNAAILSFNFVGFKAQEIPINSNYISVNLESESMMVEELVVTGFGASRSKKSMGYSANKDKSNPIPISTVDYQTSFTFQIDIPYDIPSTGRSISVTLDNIVIPAIYRYISVPKIQPEAFLESRFTDWEQFNLLDGEANLYFENKYVGKTILQVSNAEDTLNLSLGKDESITIKRTKLQTFKEKNFIGNKRTEKREFEISIRNNKKESIDLLLNDQIPVSTNEEIKVKDVSEVEAKLNSKSGILEWQLKILPGEIKKLKFSYTVEYQSGKNIVLE